MKRRILHIDMDAFFASVEQVLNPALKGKALIIGGTKEDVRGVVCTASYEARKFGVHSAMPLTQAKRLCPHGIFMRGSFEHYAEASQKVRDVLDTVSPLVEPMSIDEAYIDITGSLRLFGGEDAIANYIKERIREATQLPCTVAIASNKLVAKVASDEGKPDGYLCIATGDERAFLAPLPIGKLPGIGPRTRETLESFGMKTIGVLASFPIDKLMRYFGQSGYGLQRAAQGICTAEVEPDSIAKSVGRETTFPRDLLDWREVERILAYLAERAAYGLREKGMEARCVTLKVRYGDFQTNTFAKTLPEPTCIDAEIIEALRILVPKARERRASVRLIGVSLSSLTFNQHQLSLFGRKNAEKWEKALEGVDQIRDRHGFGYLRFAKSMSTGKDDLSTPSLSR
jgi:DNA polymerase-4